jgi:hypothetical protein
MRIEVLEAGACATRLRVHRDDDTTEVVRLWIIVGGTPALGLDDYGYTRRYPVVEQYADGTWQGWKYQHQRGDARTMRVDPADAPGVEVLPGGMADVESFLSWAVPLRDRRNMRMRLLPPVREIRSCRVHDADEGTYVWASASIREHGVSPITFESGSYCGRADESIRLFPEVWQRAAAILNPLFDTHTGMGAWESLDDATFEAVRAVLWELYTESLVQQERVQRRKEQRRESALRRYWAGMRTVYEV